MAEERGEAVDVNICVMGSIDESVNYEMQWGDWTGSHRALLAALGTDGMIAPIIGADGSLAELTRGNEYLFYFSK